LGRKATSHMIKQENTIQISIRTRTDNTYGIPIFFTTNYVSK